MDDARRNVEPADEAEGSPAGLAKTLLREVLAGDTYDVVASRHGITRTGVERRIKTLAAQVAVSVGIVGLNLDGTAFVRRLRAHREAVLAALAHFGASRDSIPAIPCEIQVLSPEEVASGASRLRARSENPIEDMALYFLLLATGARPLEIARLQVLDYLAPDGTVRTASELRAELAINGRARPLHFRSTRLETAIGDYLSHRLQHRQGIGQDDRYRGLDPLSRLFLSPTGQGFEILAHGENGRRRFRCRAIQEAYRKIWRCAGFKNLTTLDVRHTVADRLYARGADEMQVGLLLGISERAAVRQMFPRRLRTLEQLSDQLV